MSRKLSPQGLAAAFAGVCNKLTLKVAGNAGDSVTVQKQGFQARKLWEAFKPHNHIV